MLISKDNRLEKHSQISGISSISKSLAKKKGRIYINDNYLLKECLYKGLFYNTYRGTTKRSLIPRPFAKAQTRIMLLRLYIPPTFFLSWLDHENIFLSHKRNRYLHEVICCHQTGNFAPLVCQFYPDFNFALCGDDTMVVGGDDTQVITSPANILIPNSLPPSLWIRWPRPLS